jgi:hypothetical protein
LKDGNIFIDAAFCCLKSGIVLIDASFCYLPQRPPAGAHSYVERPCWELFFEGWAGTSEQRLSGEQSAVAGGRCAGKEKRLLLLSCRCI